MERGENTLLHCMLGTLSTTILYCTMLCLPLECLYCTILRYKMLCYTVLYYNWVAERSDGPTGFLVQRYFEPGRTSERETTKIAAWILL